MAGSRFGSGGMEQVTAAAAAAMLYGNYYPAPPDGGLGWSDRLLAISRAISERGGGGQSQPPFPTQHQVHGQPLYPLHRSPLLAHHGGVHLRAPTFSPDSASLPDHGREECKMRSPSSLY